MHLDHVTRRARDARVRAPLARRGQSLAGEVVPAPRRAPLRDATCKAVVPLPARRTHAHATALGDGLGAGLADGRRAHERLRAGILAHVVGLGAWAVEEGLEGAPDGRGRPAGRVEAGLYRLALPFVGRPRGEPDRAGLAGDGG